MSSMYPVVTKDIMKQITGEVRVLVLGSPENSSSGSKLICTYVGMYLRGGLMAGMGDGGAEQRGLSVRS